MPEHQEIRRSQERFSEFIKAFATLEHAFSLMEEQERELTDLERDGVLQRFEFTVELAWKVLQDVLSERGYSDVKGPKPVIKQAFQDGLIKDGHTWIQMITSRNETSHLYSEERSAIIFHRIQTEYIQLLRDFKADFSTNL
ncbi:MAG: nucleotidyltransferase [Candidatus Kapaibacterium sp.]|nr:MAG: nucleotidyltransferase [Candidatus Kapabacteria bacterium]